MSAKITAIALCLFYTTHAGNLQESSSGLDYGTSASQGSALEHNMEYGSRARYAAAYGKKFEQSPLKFGSRFEDASPEHGTTLGYIANAENGAKIGSNSFIPQINSGYARPAISTISHYSIHKIPVAKTYPSSLTGYSNRLGPRGHGSYAMNVVAKPAVSTVSHYSIHRTPVANNHALSLTGYYNGLGSHGHSDDAMNAFSRPAISTVSHYSIHKSPVAKTYTPSITSYSSTLRSSSSRPAVSTVSHYSILAIPVVKNFAAPTDNYASGNGGHGAYNTAISNNYVNGNGYGSNGNKW